MNSHDIAAFLAICEHKTLSAAADELFISQPTLSRRITALEEEVGYQLIERRKGVKSVTLTEQGRAFILVALQWKSLWQKTEALRNYQNPQRFMIEAPDGQTNYAFIDVLTDFNRAHPGLDFHVQTGKSVKAYADLRHREIDLGIVITPMHSENIVTVPFYKEEMWCLSHRDRRCPAVTPVESLPPEKYIAVPRPLEFNLWYQVYFGSTTPCFHCDQVGTIAQYIAKDPACWSVAPATIAYYLREDPALRITKFSSPPPERIMYYSYLKQDAAVMPLIDDFVRLSHERFSHMEGVEILN